MKLFDYSTMPLRVAISWDPTSIAGRAIESEPWKGVPSVVRQDWLEKLNSKENDVALLSKLLDEGVFLSVIIRGSELHSQIIALENFERFISGPILYGPYDWPVQK